ncbi:hypothetical protein [Pseudomonas sp. MYb118]|uniref:hypothetical protein n=1 Tax=Pseudomonas sp. MYb118 TaxID=1848720 RepID=UPI0034CEA842
MKTIRFLAYAGAFASIMSLAHAAEIPLGTKTLEGQIISKVLAVDAANHQVTIEDAEGKPVVIQLSDQAKNLDNLKVGDKVDIQVARSVAYVLDTTEGGQPGVSNESMVARAGKDNPNPGGEAIRQVRVTSKITAIDLNKHEVTLLPPEGQVRVVKVENPDLQARMSKLKVGQTVDAVFTEVLKVTTSR